MSEAPERIWLIETDKYNPYRVSCSTAPHSPDESTEYVRADRIEALEREVAELRASRDGYVKQAVAREAEAERKIAELEAINAILMGDDEDKPRYTTRRMKQEVARQTEVVRQELIVAEAREARLSEALRPFADMADYLDSETEGFADTDEFDLLYEDHLFHHFKVADFRAARAALSGSGSGWRETVDAARKAVEELAHTQMQLPLSEWNRISNAILAALPAAPQQGDA